MDLLHKWVQTTNFQVNYSTICNHGNCGRNISGEKSQPQGMCDFHRPIYWEQQLTWLGKKLLRGARKPSLEFDFNKNPPKPEAWKS